MDVNTAFSLCQLARPSTEMNPNFWYQKRVLVTGHTGFKGSWLCLLLNSFGAKVAGYALSPPTNPNLYSATRVGELVEHGAACLLVSHDRAFVRAVATRVWVIEGKRLVEVDDPEPVFDRLMAN